MYKVQDGQSLSIDFAYHWYRLWFCLAGIAALIVTFTDAAFLQLKYNIFTGGFLSMGHLKSPLEVAIFFTTSIIADLGITVPLTGTVLWATTRLKLNTRPSVLTVLVVTIVPFAIWTFFTYQLHLYLGQAFDAAITFELSGGSIVEIMVVAAPQIFLPLIFLIFGVSGTIIAVWIYKSLLRRWHQLPKIPRSAGVIATVGATILLSLVVTCAAWSGSDLFKSGLRQKMTGVIFSSIGETLTDIDRDGYGLIRRPLDPAPMDSAVFPYAIDVPGNGVDENGVAGDLPLLSVQNPGSKLDRPVWMNKPNIIFFLLESFRAELVGARFKDKPITPSINGIIGAGGVGATAFSHIGFTAPSRYHIFSGALASHNEKMSLIDDFKNNGYEVAYFSAQDAQFGGSRYDTGYSRADVIYDAQVEPERRFTTFSTPASIGLPYQVIVEKISDFLRNRRQDRPLFLYINFQDTHFPYYHKHIRNIVNSASLARINIGPDRADELWATYVNTVANVDMAIGEVLDTTRQFLNDPNPGIIITSDHGESLYDDGYLGHGIVLNDVQTKVPLVIANLPVTIAQPFGHSDLRDAINRALQYDPSLALVPTVIEDPERRVFQVLGDFKRPRQIAFRDKSGRTIYDFREGRFKGPAGSWQRPDNLSPSDKADFVSLIHYWEREVLAAQAAR